ACRSRANSSRIAMRKHSSKTASSCRTACWRCARTCSATCWTPAVPSRKRSSSARATAMRTTSPVCMNNLYAKWCAENGKQPLDFYAFKCTAAASGNDDKEDYDLYDVLAELGWRMRPRTRHDRALAFTYKHEDWLDALPPATAATVRAIASQFERGGT